jgi:hypothetical protein
MHGDVVHLIHPIEVQFPNHVLSQLFHCNLYMPRGNVAEMRVIRGAWKGDTKRRGGGGGKGGGKEVGRCD